MSRILQVHLNAAVPAPGGHGFAILLTSAGDLRALPDELPPAPSRRIGEELVARGFLRPEELAEGLAYKTRLPNRRLGWILVMLGFVRQEQLDEVLASRAGIPIVSIGAFRQHPDQRGRLPQATAARLGIALLHEDERTAWVALADAVDERAREVARFVLGKRVVFVHASRAEIEGFHRRCEPGAVPPVGLYDDAPVGCREGLAARGAAPEGPLDYPAARAA